MKLFSLSVPALILRFYLLMGIVIGAFFAGFPWVAILALPVFLSAMMGLQIHIPNLHVKRRTSQQRQVSKVHQQTAH
ncbi:MAG TPA: hypothetical protein VFG10_05300 [Saprospiraceae bacterium]|nr:hypothetical protein [Saprospiraceae bacterium]